MTARRTTSFLFAIAGALLFSQIVSSQQAAPREIPSGLLAEVAGGRSASYVVVLRERADLTAATAASDRRVRGRLVYQALKAIAESSQRPLLDVLRAEAALGRVQRFRSFFSVNAIAVTSNETTLRRLASLPQVEQVFEAPLLSIPDPVPGTVQARVQSVEWNVAKVRAPEVWARGVTGQGIVIASLDTGVEYTHPALVGHYRGNLGGGAFDHNYNWWDATATCPSPAPCDDNQHGTHTTGTMVGSDGGANLIGVAPGATWIGCKALLGGGAGIIFDLLECGDWVVAPWDLNHQNPNPDRRPHIVNNSWGLAFGGYPFLQTMVNNWRAAGIFPAFAAGNNGPNCGSVSSPGDYVQSFATGAADMNDVIASFSGRGPSVFGAVKPDVTAPGVNVRSSVPGGGYAAFSGTSMASPHTAGLVALLWSEFPNLARDITSTERKIRPAAVILNSSQGCGGSGSTDHPNNTFGFGRIDAVETGSAFPVYTNRSVYHVGDQLTLSVSLVNPFPATWNVDAYLGLKLPNGQILMNPFGTLPLPASLKLFDQTQLSFVVTAAQAPGSYLAFAVLALPGSNPTNPANLLSVDLAPFEIQ
jgi:subtilisin family serine protease